MIIQIKWDEEGVDAKEEPRQDAKWSSTDPVYGATVCAKMSQLKAFFTVVTLLCSAFYSVFIADKSNDIMIFLQPSSLLIDASDKKLSESVYLQRSGGLY